MSPWNDSRVELAGQGPIHLAEEKEIAVINQCIGNGPEKVLPFYTSQCSPEYCHKPKRTEPPLGHLIIPAPLSN
ncbi:MAG: hypothetical protein MK108_12035 [Mariniblastus sp.]|nr:hypothetical protein [Mariniblastus sp.]